MTQWSWLLIRQQLRRLERLKEAQSQEIRKAKLNNQNGHIQAKIRRDLGEMIWLEEQMIDAERSDLLIAKAKRMDLAIPTEAENESWAYSSGALGRCVLTETGRSELRRRIRDERKGQIEWVLPYLTLAAAVIAAISSLYTVVSELSPSAPTPSPATRSGSPSPASNAATDDRG